MVPDLVVDTTFGASGNLLLEFEDDRALSFEPLRIESFLSKNLRLTTSSHLVKIFPEALDLLLVGDIIAFSLIMIVT